MTSAAENPSRARRTARTALSIGGALLLVALAPGPARAQLADTDAKAAALFKEGRALMESGQYAEACPKLAESLGIDPGMGTLFNLSDCYEHIGRTASAWSGFRDVAAAAEAAGKGPRARTARERALALEPKLSKLRIVVSKETGALSGAHVQRDGVQVGSLLWGTDVPVDPGSHLVSASATGMSSWSTTVVVDEPGKVVTVVVPPLSKLAVASGETPLVVATVTPPPPRPPEEKGIDGALVVSVGMSAIMLGTGAALVVLSNSKQEEALELRSGIPSSGDGLDNECLATPKPAGCADLEHAAKLSGTMKALSIGAFAFAGLGVAGTLAYLLSPKSPPPRPGQVSVLGVAPAIGSSSGGVAVVGTF